MSAEGMAGKAPNETADDEKQASGAYPAEPVEDAEQAVEAADYEVKERFGE